MTDLVRRPASPPRGIRLRVRGAVDRGRDVIRGAAVLVVNCFAPRMYQSGRPACSVISSVELKPSVISDKALKRLSAMAVSVFFE